MKWNFRNLSFATRAKKEEIMMSKIELGYSSIRIRTLFFNKNRVGNLRPQIQS